MWSTSTTLVLGLVASAQAVIRPSVQMQFHHRMEAEMLDMTEFAGMDMERVAAVANVTLDTVALPIDHNGNHPGTFQNRYWTMEQYYKPGSPVFIYDAGEGNAEPNAIARLVSNASFFNQLVREFNGIGIVWEHRYYGASTPFNISLTTPAEEMQYLSAEQALADVPYFAKQFSRKNFPKQDLTPKGTPWVFTGGSYPGMRASFMRTVYPDTVFASWASSAPVEARVDMGIYFEQVYRGLQAYGFGNCTKNIQSAVNYIDGELGASKARSAAIKNYLFGPGGSDNLNTGVADVLSYIFYQWQSYGVEGAGGLRSFCDWISTDENDAVAPAQGWEATKGKKWIAERWADWPEWIDTVNQDTPTNCAGRNGTVTADTKCQLDLPFPDPDAVSWTWQYCTEWGFMQQSNFGPNRIGSKYNTLQHQKEICYRQFPDGLNSGLLPKSPRVDKTNKFFGGWGSRPSRVFYTGGQFDPWRTLSKLSTESFAPKGISVNHTIPSCESGGSKTSFFGYQLSNAEHCFDLRTTFAESVIPQKMFKDALTSWLPCWKPTGQYAGGY